MQKVLTVSLATLVAFKIVLGIIGYGFLFSSAVLQLNSYVLAIQFIVLVSVGLFLFYNGPDDERALCFGMVALLAATAYTGSGLPHLAEVRGITLAAFADKLALDAFFPYYFWRFVRLFPRAFVATRVTYWIRIGNRIVLFIALALFLVNVLHYFVPDLGAASLLDNQDPASLFPTLTYGLAIPALFVLLYRARIARVSEQRRVKVFVVGLIVSMLPPLIFIFVTGISETAMTLASGAAGRTYVIPLLQLCLLAPPVITAYAIVVERILPTRVILKRTAGYGVGYFCVILFVLSPFLLLFYYLFQSRSLSLAEAVSGSNGFFLGLALLVAILFFRQRRLAMAHLEELFFRSRYDVNEQLNQFIEWIANVQSLTELRSHCQQILDNTLHPDESYLLLATNNSYYQELSGRLAPVDLDSSLAAALPEDRSRPVTGIKNSPLSEAESLWLTQANCEVITPVKMRGRVIAYLLLGDKKSELPYSSGDLKFLDLLANALVQPLSQFGEDHQPAVTSEPASACDRCATVIGNGATCPQCGSDASSILQLPPVLFDRYQLRQALGSDQAPVFLADDLRLNRQVVLKTARLSSADELRYFRHEARLMATLNHPNIAAIYDYDSCQSIPVLICEYLPNGTLEELLSGDDSEQLDVLTVFSPLLEALAYLHRNAVVHGDIKPANIGFDSHHSPKLFDFGLSRKKDQHSQVILYGDGFDGGTFSYLSPERIRGAEASPDSDLWSLTVTVYETLFGENLFAAQSIEDTAEKIRHCSETLHHSKGANLEFFKTALHPNAAMRPHSASQLLALLQKTLPAAGQTTKAA